MRWAGAVLGISTAFLLWVTAADIAQAHHVTAGPDGKYAWCAIRVSAAPIDGNTVDQPYSYKLRCTASTPLGPTSWPNGDTLQIVTATVANTQSGPCSSSNGQYVGPFSDTAATESFSAGNTRYQRSASNIYQGSSVAPSFGVVYYRNPSEAHCRGTATNFNGRKHADVSALFLPDHSLMCAGLDCAVGEDHRAVIVDYGVGNEYPPWPPLGGEIPEERSRGDCGEGGVDGDSDRLTSCLSDPVNTASGAFTETVTDVELPAPGLSFRLARSYTSAETESGPLGVGWTHSYASRLITEADGDRTLQWGSGQRVRFDLQANGSYAAPQGIDSSLTAVAGGFEVTTPDLRRFSFDASGKLTQISDRNANTVSLAYVSGTLGSATDTAGQLVSFTHDGAGRLTQVVLPDGRSVSYGYTSGRLTSVTDLRGQTWTYTYDAGGRLATEVNPAGQTTVSNTYDASGRVVEQRDALNNLSTFSYTQDPGGSLTTTMTDARGKVWKDIYRYNMLQKRIDPLGNETTISRDDDLNLAEVPRPGSNPWLLTWDANGNLTKRRAVAPLNHEETFTYNASNNLTSSTDGLGRTTTYGYDPDGNLTSVAEPGGATTTITRDPDNGLPTAIQDARGKTWTYTYDGGAGAYPDVVLGDTPWGYWRFGETSGTTANDASGNDRDGTYTGGVTLGVDGAITGDADKAASFDGTNDHVAPSALLNSGVATVEAWIKVDAVPSTVREIVGFHNGLASGITDKRLVLANDGKIYFHVWDGANRYTSTPSTSVPLGQWTHVAGVTDGTTAKVYQDGVEVGSVAAGQSFAAYTVPNVYIAAGGVHVDGGTGYFPGAIDEAAVYSSALSAARIQAHHEAGQQGQAPPPGAGNLTEVRSPLGLRTTMTYDARGFMTSRTDPRGNEPGANRSDFTTTYTYDDAGNVLTETDPLDGVTTYAYDAAGRLTSRTDARGKLTTYTYNAAGEVTKITAPDGGETTYTYDESGNLLTETDAEGGVTTYTYDAAGRMATKSDPRGKTSTYTYDAAGQLTSETTPLGNKTTYAYDVLGRLTSRVDPRGNAPGATPAEHTRAFDYDPVGNLIEETDPPGNATSFTHDHRGRVLTETDPAGKTTTRTYDAVSNLLTEADPLGNTTTNSYDDDGRLVLTTDPRAKTSSSTYDAAGNLTKTTTPLGFKETMTYDALNRVTSRTDPRGNQPGATPSDFKTTFTHDPAGNLLTETDPLGKTTSYAYDNVSNRTTKTDALGRVTTYTYDRLRRMKTLRAPDLALTSYAYDPSGNLTSRTDANNHTTTLTYDDDGRLTSDTTPLGNVTSYAYDADGNLTTEVDPRGNATPAAGDFTTTSTYDRAGRLVGIDYSDATPDVAFTYDARALRTQMTDGAGTETRTYDDSGRLTAATRGTTSVSYLYDAASNVTRRTYPGGAQANLTYDDDGRLASVTGPGGAATYTYDAADHQIVLSRPNGTTTFLAYDRVGRPTLVSHRKGGNAFATYTYSYDAVGNPTTLGETPEGQITYRYDAQDRVIEACYVQACGALLNPVFIRYTYDKVGNRLQETRQTGTTTYTYDADDRVTSSVGGSGTTAYTHDAAGNMIGAGARTVTYDLAGLTKTITDGGTATTYAYDGDGKRASASTSAATTNFVWDPNAPIPELLEEQTASGGLVRRYVQGNELLSVTTPSATSFYHGDSLGSVISVTDQAGDQDWSHAYEPFGADRTTVQRDLLAPTQPMRFTGQHLDPTALYHLRARQYDPGLGRFTARDPLPPVDGESLVASHVYASGRPTVLVDPSGLRGNEPGFWSRLWNSNLACPYLGRWFGGDAFCEGYVTLPWGAQTAIATALTAGPIDLIIAAPYTAWARWGPAGVSAAANALNRWGPQISGDPRVARVVAFFADDVVDVGRKVTTQFGSTDIDVVLKGQKFLQIGGPAKGFDPSRFGQQMQRTAEYAKQMAGRGYFYYDEGTPDSVLKIARRWLTDSNVRPIP